MLLESCCILNELRHWFEVNETDEEWVCYVKSNRHTLDEMKESISNILTGHYGLFYRVLATKDHPQQGRVLKILIHS